MMTYMEQAEVLIEKLINAFGKFDEQYVCICGNYLQTVCDPYNIVSPLKLSAEELEIFAFCEI